MSDMITNHADIDVFIGIDVGKHNHHAVALDRDGKQLLSKALSSPGFRRGSFSWFPKQPRTPPRAG